MQNIDEYESRVHTAGQAIDRARQCCGAFGYDIGDRTMNTFKAGLLFVMSLLTSDLILKTLPANNFLSQFSVIMVLIVVIVIFEYTQKLFESAHKNAVTNAHLYHHVRHGYAHTFFQT